MSPEARPPMAEGAGVAADRPAAPEPAMILDGGVVPGDVSLMVRCMVEELLQMGMPFERIAAMTRDPGYQALYAARQAMGDRGFDRLMDDCYRRVGCLAHTTIEQETPVGATRLPLHTEPKPLREARDA